MKFRLLTTALICVVNLLHAQKLIGKIPVSKGESRNVQGFAVGDSTFFSFDIFGVDYSKASKIQSTKLIIGPDGTIKKLALPELKDKNIICLNADDDSLYFNYLEEKKHKIQMRVIAMSKKNGDQRLIETAHLIEEAILGSFDDHGFNLVTLNPHDTTLNFNRIIKNTIHKTATYKMPTSLFKGSKRTFAFIREGDEIEPKAAAATIKIYCTPKEIIVTEKIPFVKNQGTVVTRINRETGKSESKLFKEQSGAGYFNSFFIGENIFTVYRKNGLHIVESNWNQNSNKEYVINKKTPYANEDLYNRKESIWDGIANTGAVFVAGYLNEEGTIYLKTGTHKIVKSGAGLPPFSAIPIFGVLAAFVNLTTWSMDEGYSVNYIFYLKRDDAGFSHVKSPDLAEIKLHEKIISYEKDAGKNISNEVKHKYLDAGTFKDPYNNFRWYIKNTDPREIEIVRFDFQRQ